MADDNKLTVWVISTRPHTYHGIYRPPQTQYLADPDELETLINQRLVVRDTNAPPTAVRPGVPMSAQQRPQDLPDAEQSAEPDAVAVPLPPTPGPEGTTPTQPDTVAPPPPSRVMTTADLPVPPRTPRIRRR